MAAIGYTLSSEENGARELVAQAARAEEDGFAFAGISDHFHPWVDRQGESPFVWGVLGAIAEATERLQLVTGVTCPTTRIHPAIVAQAAATAALLLPGRFSLGVGTGEDLNEHILGDRWPAVAERQERLGEAIEVIRLLWEGGPKSHRGKHYTVENARIYSLPDEFPPILVAVAGTQSADLAADFGDGLIGTAPVAETIERFREKAGKVEEDDIGASIVCGPDPQRHVEAIEEYAAAGYDHVYVHQVGPDQEGFFDFYSREVLPQLNGS